MAGASVFLPRVVKARTSDILYVRLARDVKSEDAIRVVIVAKFGNDCLSQARSQDNGLSES